MQFPILLPNIFNYPFTYESNLNLSVGDFVEVPFGTSKKIGVVWNEFEKKNEKNFKIKRIIKKLDIPKLNIKTLNIKRYYHIYLKWIIPNQTLGWYLIKDYWKLEPQIYYL